jgi:hypothetical protein
MVGGSTHHSSMFGAFADPQLQLLFEPPNYRRYNDEEIVVVVVSVTLCLPFLLAAICLIIKICFNKIRKQPAQRWKSWALQYPYLLFVNFAAAALIALVVYLYNTSELPDPDCERE